jgi:ABC-type branched-subunit amino acid transport system ATPase component
MDPLGPSASVLQLADALRGGELSAIELLDACLEVVDRRNPELNAVIWRNDDDARAAAKEADRRIAAGDPAPFLGIPLPIKDLTPVAGWPVTYGSRGAPPGPSKESEPAIDAFLDAGFVLCGRTNTPEFGPLTVAENLDLGAYSKRREGAAILEAGRKRVYKLFPLLAERPSQPAATLSGGEQQMLAIGRALMSAPRLLLLDEPSLGLGPLVVREIFEALDRLRAEGVTVLLVEQDARLALKYADRGYVMRTGRVVLSGTAADLLADEDIRLIYLGQWHGKGDSR